METLSSMGFAEADCETALQRANHDVEAAINLLLGGHDTDTGNAESTQLARSPPAVSNPQSEDWRAADGLTNLAQASASQGASDDDELNRAIQMSLEASAGGGAVGGMGGPGAAAGAVVDLSIDESDGDETARAIAMSLELGGAGGAEAARPSDDEIRAHWESVVGSGADSIKDKPLVGALESLDELKQEYAEGLPVFAAKIDQLSARYCGVRRARNDGNCFYRGFAFALFEWVLQRASRSEIDRTRTLVDACKPKLLQAQFHEMAFEDCLTVFQAQVRGSRNSIICFIKADIQDFTYR